ncbi:hypothetical protein BHYA_0105g00050 [Botrytis hyacinthi]|uniref:Coatomer subunit epsilon n=1 Tax=Botrytis hyacinthi TaxID=278943 RepID=A0A4Z1GJH5_9HELO|nr:hypothetical protein BHYA_0105g00050 [Botrytis hyacinthi]
MSTKDNVYSFELCKRRGIKNGPHSIITDFGLLKAMAIKKNIAARSKETRQKTQGAPSKRLSEEDIQQHAIPHQIYTYEQLLQNYRNFFLTGPLMRCLDADKNIDERLGNELLMRLREEVLRRPPSKRPRSGIQMTFDNYRKELQIRAFWDNVRLQLQTNEEDDDINESKSNTLSEDSINKELVDHVKSKARRLRSLKLVTKIYGRRDDARFSTWQGATGSMDPFSAEGELLNLHNHFHQGQFQEAIDFDTSALSPENALSARVISLRARIALGQAEDVLADVQGEDAVELKAVGALAVFVSEDQDKGVQMISKLAEDSSDNATVQVLGGTVLQAAGKSEEALQLLGLHQGNLEAVALIVQIHLEQNRTDLAIKEVQQARRWAQDSLLVNLAESWVGLRVGGEKYQQAFYVFEELAQAPSTSSTQSLVAQAIAEIHLGRLEEAEAALDQAFSKDPENAEVLANKVVLNTISGKDSSDLLSSLGSTSPEHAFLKDLEEKSSLFDKAATKYSPKVAAA